MDMLRPSASRSRHSGSGSSGISGRASHRNEPSPGSPALPPSPASSTSTLKASSSSRSKIDSSSFTAKSGFGSSARSKGQQARRLSFESAVSTSGTRYRHTNSTADEAYLGQTSRHRPSSSTRAADTAFLALRSRPSYPDHSSELGRNDQLSSIISPQSIGKRANGKSAKKAYKPSKPLLGGLYFSDLVVVAFFYAVNLLRTCGLAELIDVAFKALAYVCTRLPFDFYTRWSLSRYPPDHSSRGEVRSPRLGATRRLRPLAHGTSSPAARTSAQASSSAVFISSEEDSSSTDDDTSFADGQLSPFHHLVILLVRFACTNFPHLLPRVLFAEETIGPLVRWRTGGGAAGIVREFSSEPVTNTLPHAETNTPDATTQARKQSQPSEPSFRAFWIGADAHVPVDVRRSDHGSRTATTLLYLHGGGFSLGSVAFYAEALIRIVTKICRLEAKENDARCIAVEYDLGPTSRFPGPLLQCLRCYAHLIEVEGIDPSAITVAGDSAGGNLAMAMLLCLDGQARDHPGLAERDWSLLPFPGSAVLISPWADLRPSASIAFAPLRNPATQQPGHSPSQKDTGHSNTSKTGGHAPPARVSVWTEAMAQYEWDYVAAEALMHFAQLYSGVLQTPRRVRGPMGWVASLCAVVAGETLDASSNPPTIANGPLQVLRSLVSPPRALARVAHNMLTDPFMDRGASDPGSQSGGMTGDPLNELQRLKPSNVGLMDPIFSKAERQTDAVRTTSDLFVPVWSEEDCDDDIDDEAQKDSIGKSQKSDKAQQGGTHDVENRRRKAEFRAAVERLESDKLINPAIGDWSRIRLRHGMLVLWGDRERLADDIEVWVEGVRATQSGYPEHPSSKRPGSDLNTTTTDDGPCQDQDPRSIRGGNTASATSIQARRAASRSPNRDTETPLPTGEWICTAVEHGPAGVHAWPFVSMYLAGTELEREKGLEIIASFIAQPGTSPPSTQAPTPRSAPAATLSVKLPHVAHGDDMARHALHPNSPPHLNAVSPAGSMPSDVDLDEDQLERDYLFHATSSSVEGSEDGWDPESRNELGLAGVYPHETVWAEPTPTPSTGAGTPAEQSDSEANETDLTQQFGLGLDRTTQPQADAASQKSHQAELQPVHLHHVASAGLRDSAQAGPYLQHQPQLPYLWHAAGPTARAEPDQPTASRPRRAHARAANPQMSSISGGGRSLADMEAASDGAITPAESRSPGWSREGSEYESSEPENEEDQIYRPSPYSSMRYADDEVIPMDPSFYGLAHYTTLRPEGLSDIAEEDSQMDASSILSGGGPGGTRSPPFTEDGMSPIEGLSPSMSAHRIIPGRHGAAYTPSTTELVRLREALEERERQYQQRFARTQTRTRAQDRRVEAVTASGRDALRARFPIEDDDDEDERGSRNIRRELRTSRADIENADVDELDEAAKPGSLQHHPNETVEDSLDAVIGAYSSSSSLSASTHEEDLPHATGRAWLSSHDLGTLGDRNDEDQTEQHRPPTSIYMARPGSSSSLLQPPSPTRSTSSQSSSAKDVWW
ncbi:hypothetical protein BCV70DRAFT_201209 [Testicularia cyperi]|uniref:Alpha/beta hydrolase fold-3 domain-containing protein n=1 Tax=Testicularia cyperi TaxID=1882483 RepID=A0A317XLP9_9BASI|nr:hypothetical protein BCV70DRAFT_201209 [Testicularia cyperi]